MPRKAVTKKNAVGSVRAVEATVQKYIDGVLDGSIVVGKLQLQAVQRHVRDLEHGHERGLWFDSDAGARVVRFFGILSHSKGEWAGKAFILSPWQQFLLWCLFGWKREDNTRRFRTAYVEVCRKAGKTTMAAGIGLYMLVADGEAGAEVYTAATKRDQARIAHTEAVRMVKASKGLKRLVGISKDNLYVNSTHSRYVALGGDADSTDGLSPSCCIIDELHAHRTRAMFDVLDTATGSRRQPLLFCITTAGHDRTTICWEMHEYAVKVLGEVLEDDSLFAFIAAIDEGDDWKDQKLWVKANPNLHISMKLDDLQRKARRAAEIPSNLNPFLRLHLGVWTEAESRWLDIEQWKACAGEVDIEELRGRMCYGGLDLSSTTDLSALVLVFPEEEDGSGSCSVLPFFWMPRSSAKLRERKDAVPYSSWIKEEYIEATEGDVVDYEAIRRRINELKELYNIKSIAIDRWNATQLATQLQGDGVEVQLFGQGYASMSPAAKELEKRVAGKQLIHPDSPVLNWMAANATLQRDASDNIKPSKAKSSGRIDGIVALTMAVGVAAASLVEKAPDFDFVIISPDPPSRWWNDPWR